MNALRIGSLFSGYGGLELGVQAVIGGEVAWHVEFDHAPSKILAHRFPGVPNYGLTRTQQLKALGNGVVPQQAALAVTTLLQAEAVAA